MSLPAPQAIGGLTVLYDAQCPMCTRFRSWLLAQDTLVRLDLVAAGSPEARRRFPRLDHARTQQEITLVSDEGAVYVGEYAWVVALWATREHRRLAEKLARPAWLPLARVSAQAAAGLRGRLRRAPGCDYAEDCAGHCQPLPQG